MGTLLKIDLPEELERALKAAGYTPERLSDEARLHLAASLFSRKVLSLEQAAKLAGMSLWDFIPFLGEQDIAVSDFDEEDSEPLWPKGTELLGTVGLSSRQSFLFP
jgi:predicted HTH domain antitoxin